MASIEEIVEKNLKNVTEGAQLAITLIAPTYRFGGNWALVRNDETLKETIDILRQEKEYVKATVVSNGLIVQAKEDYLVSTINKLLPNAVNGSFIEKAKKRNEEDKIKYLKFVKKVYDGKESHIEYKNGCYEITVGIYSTNDVNQIRTGGKEYPCYKLTLQEALIGLASEYKGKGMVGVYSKNRSGADFISLDQIMNNTVALGDVFKGLEIARTDTGVFLTIRISK